MKPLWKVKSFEQYTSWNVHENACVHVYISIYIYMYIYFSYVYNDLESGCA